MKLNFTLLCILFVFLFSLSSFARVRTVGNSNVPAEYQNLQTAITEATAGDTIYIYGGADYPAVNVTKQLTFIGTGWKPLKSGAPATNVERFYLQSGSGGSVFIGMITAVDSYYAQDIQNILIKRCMFNSSSSIRLTTGCNNWVVEENIFTNGFIDGQSTVFNSLIVRNNIFCRTGYIHSINAGSQNVVKNNVFVAQYSSATYALYNVKEVTFMDNIFYGRTLDYGSSNNTFLNNIIYTSSVTAIGLAWGSGSNNIFADPQFVNYSTTATGVFSQDFYAYDFRIKTTAPASPGAGAGYFSTTTSPTNIGFGIAVFNMNGTPFIPQITAFAPSPSAPVINQGGSFNVNVSVKTQYQ